MKITRITDEDVWWGIAKQCRQATFFHTPLWHRLATKTLSNYEDISVHIELDNGGQAVFPLLTIKRAKGLTQRIFSTYAGCYGGLLTSEEIPSAKQKEIYRHVYSNGVSQLYITSNPIAKQKVFAQEGKVNNDFTHILMLNADFESIYKGFSKGHKSSFKRGERLGVTVRVAKSLMDYRAYYGAYEDSLRRWGNKASSFYPWELFKNGFELSQKYPENIKLWLAEVDQIVIAGAWVFYWNQHVDWWHGAAYEKWFDYYPNNVLQTVIIKDAIEKGFKFYDFNPSGGHESVAHFKKRFGAEKVKVIRQEFATRGFQLGQKFKELIRQ